MKRPELEGHDDDAASRDASGADWQIAPKEYYSMGEVCEIVGLRPHVLRYWESQFPVLNPSKNRSGNRVFQKKEIKLVLLVKHLLYREKYTIDGARRKLDQLRRGGELKQAAQAALEPETITLLRAELEELSELLQPPDDPAPDA
ncbi:MAG: MerR family transcriptional regulator [Longimicrobiales bacterium]